MSLLLSLELRWSIIRHEPVIKWTQKQIWPCFCDVVDADDVMVVRNRQCNNQRRCTSCTCWISITSMCETDSAGWMLLNVLMVWNRQCWLDVAWCLDGVKQYDNQRHCTSYTVMLDVNDFNVWNRQCWFGSCWMSMCETDSAGWGHAGCQWLLCVKQTVLVGVMLDVNDFNVWNRQCCLDVVWCLDGVKQTAR